MQRQDYFPSRQGPQPEWLGNYARRTLEFGPIIGLSAATVSGTVADALFLKYVIGDWLPAVREYGPGCTQALATLCGGTAGGPFLLPGFIAPPLPGADPLATPPLPATVPVPAGALDRIFMVVKEMKSKPGLTPEMALLLGIVGPEETTPPPGSTVPRIKVSAVAGAEHERAKLGFFKDGHEYVVFQCRRGPNGQWEDIGMSDKSPFYDERPLLVPGQAEIREYRARFFDHGAPNGDWCDVTKVTVSP